MLITSTLLLDNIVHVSRHNLLKQHNKTSINRIEGKSGYLDRAFLILFSILFNNSRSIAYHYHYHYSLSNTIIIRCVDCYFIYICIYCGTWCGTLYSYHYSDRYKRTWRIHVRQYTPHNAYKSYDDVLPVLPVCLYIVYMHIDLFLWREPQTCVFSKDWPFVDSSM